MNFFAALFALLVVSPVVVSTGPDAALCGVVIERIEPPLVPAGTTIELLRVPEGNLYPVGNTTLQWRTTDALGVTTLTDQIVTVIDTTPPQLAAPGDTVKLSTIIPAPANTALEAAHGYDNCGSVFVDDDAPDFLPAGTTVVTYVATDSHGNVTSARQSVTIVPAATITVTGTLSTRSGKIRQEAPLALDLEVFDAVKHVRNLGTALAPPDVQIESGTILVRSGQAHLVRAHAIVNGEVITWSTNVPALATGAVATYVFDAELMRNGNIKLSVR